MNLQPFRLPSFSGGENDNIYLFYDCFRGPIDGSHLDMLYHMMAEAIPFARCSNKGYSGGQEKDWLAHLEEDIPVFGMKFEG